MNEAPLTESGREVPLDVTRYVGAVRRHWIVVIMGMLACGVSALIMSVTREAAFTAEVALTVAQSKIGASDNRGVSTANFRPYIESQSIAKTVLRETGLDKAPWNLSATRFFGEVVTIEEIRNSFVILLRAKLADARLVAQVVNRTSELAVEASRRVSQLEAVRTRDDIKMQMDEAHARLLQAEDALRRFRSEAQVELLKKDVEALLVERLGLLPLLVKIEAEKAKLGSLERELKSRQRFGTITKSVGSDPVMTELAGSSGLRGGDLLKTEMKDEFVSEVYENIDRDLAASRTTLAALEKQKFQLIDVGKLDRANQSLLTRLYERESVLGRLEVERDLARRVFVEVATNYETARLLVAGRSAQLQIVEVAQIPDRAESRNPLRNVLAGLVAGLALSVLAVILFDSLWITSRRT